MSQTKTKTKTRRRRRTTATTKPTRNGTLASQADKYTLYQQAVQEPEHEVEFFDRVYRARHKRLPKVLREDFCGTFAVCCEWVKKPGRVAIGVDLDPEPLEWGREHNLAALTPEQQARVHLQQRDVRTVDTTKADVLAAQNFSFWLFKTRPLLRRYFEIARQNLAPGGLMVLDMMGGYECLEEDHRDVRRIKGFRYIWEQERFDPVTHDSTYHIHFRFKDGSELKRAFSYHWRFWTVPEVRELLEEAGFSRVDVYWEGTDEETGEGDDEWRIVKHAASDPAWIAYIVAMK